MCCEKKDNFFIIRDFNAGLVFYVRSHYSYDGREREREEIFFAEWYRCMLCDIVYVVHGPFGWSLMEDEVWKNQIKKLQVIWLSVSLCMTPRYNLK